MAYSELEWPADLPASAQRPGYSSGLADNTIRTDFDSGTPRVRRTSSAGMDRRKVTYILNDAQRGILEDFLVLSEGRSFWWRNVGGPDAAWRYVRVNSENRENLFVSLAPGWWQVILTLEVWPYVTR
jgi:hypothetical protein